MRLGAALLLFATTSCLSPGGQVSWPEEDYERAFLLSLTADGAMRILRGPFSIKGGRTESVSSGALSLPEDGSMVLVAWNPSVHPEPHPAAVESTVVPVQATSCFATGQFIPGDELRFSGPIDEHVLVARLSSDSGAFDTLAEDVRSELALEGIVDPSACTGGASLKPVAVGLDYPIDEVSSAPFDAGEAIHLDDGRFVIASSWSAYIVDPRSRSDAPTHRLDYLQLLEAGAKPSAVAWNMGEMAVLENEGDQIEVLIAARAIVDDVEEPETSIFHVTIGGSETSSATVVATAPFEIRNIERDPSGGVVAVGWSEQRNFDGILVSRDGRKDFETHELNRGVSERFWTINPTGLAAAPHVIGTREHKVYVGDAFDGDLQLLGELHSGVDTMTLSVENGELSVWVGTSDGKVWRWRGRPETGPDWISKGVWLELPLAYVPDGQHCLSAPLECDKPEPREPDLGELHIGPKSGRGQGLALTLYGCEAPYLTFIDGCTAPLPLGDLPVRGGLSRKLVLLGKSPPGTVMAFTRAGDIYETSF